MLTSYVSALIVVSTDGGGTWTRHNTPSSMYASAYGNGIWVATAGSASATTYTSTDNGTTWITHLNTIPTGNWLTIKFGNGVFMAADNTGNGVAYSTDGVNWSTVSGLAAGGWRGVAYGNGVFAVSQGGSNAATIV